MTNPPEHSPVYLPGGVVLPGDLDASLRDGRLVVFVGAGASRDAPSDLQDFEGLTAEILRMAGLTDPPRKPFENQLGDLQDSGFGVHSALRSAIGKPGSAPNRWHKAIADLFPSPDQARIVTTNYDIHLESALVTTEIWSAPALPLGDSFTGVVHLHGSLDGPDDGLVLTDSDFGRAYLTQGWARRLLLTLFQSYDVLFVGYSHEDLVMQYLARGLPPSSDRLRCALVGPGQKLDWRRFRIDAIEWEHDPTDQFGPGVKAIEEWGRRNRWSALAHTQHIERLVTGGPVLDPVEESYLTRALDEPARVAVFTRYATGDEWLEWASRKQTFKTLFNRDAVLSEAQNELARWFARTYVISGQGNALHVLAEQGGKISAGLWRALAYALWNPGPSRPGIFGPWVGVLCQHDHGEDPTIINYLLNECVLPGDASPLLLLVQRAFEPNLRTRPGISFPGHPPSVYFDIDVVADEYWVEEAMKNIVKPSITVIADGLYSLATSVLTLYFHLYDALGQVFNGHDPISRGRPAIEAHAQNRYGDAALLAVDLAREAALERASKRGVSVVADELVATQVPILTRLAAWLVATV